MNSDINLVSSKTQQVEAELKRIKALKIAAISSLAVVGLISILLFIITVTLPVSSVKKNQEQTLSNISALHEKLTKYTLIDNRVNNIEGIINSRKDYTKLLNTLLDKLPPDLTVDSMIIDAGTFTFVVSAQSLTPIDNFIEDVRILGNKENLIKNLSIQSLIVNAGGAKYILTLQADTL